MDLTSNKWRVSWSESEIWENNKKSVRFCQNQSKSHWIYLISCRNLKIFALEFGNFYKEILVRRSVRVFGFGGGKLKSTCQSQFLEVKTCCRLPEQLGRLASDRICSVSSCGSSLWNSNVLDNTNNNLKLIEKITAAHLVNLWKQIL